MQELLSRRGNGRMAGYAAVASTPDGQKNKLVVEVISCTFLSVCLQIKVAH